MAYNETVSHGTPDFPFAIYRLNRNMPKYEMPYHFHTFLELVRVKKGRLEISLNNKFFTLNENEYCVVNSEVIHGAKPFDCEYECLVFDLNFLKTNNKVCNDFIDNLLLHRIKINEKIADKSVTFVLDSLFDNFSDDKGKFVFETVGYVNLFLSKVIADKLYYNVSKFDEGKAGKNIDKLKKALRFINVNYKSEITLSDVAAVTGLSEKYFCAVFKSFTGKTPFEYILGLRAEKAATALLVSDSSVTDIAFDNGFNDLSYFIKTFKKKYGVSPAKYRHKDNN